MVNFKKMDNKDFVFINKPLDSKTDKEFSEFLKFLKRRKERRKIKNIKKNPVAHDA